MACVIGVPTAAIEIAPMDCLSNRLLLPLEGQERRVRFSLQSDAFAGKGRILHYNPPNTARGPTAKRTDGRKDALGTP